jgi:PAS domain S-box-containing protein
MNSGFRVLYAEDNALDADLTRAYFSEHASEFDIEIVETGQACLDRLSATGCNVLLLDYHLPDMEGLDVLRTLARNGVPFPVVLVTGSGDEDLVVKALHLGAANYVPKLGNYLETLPGLLRSAIEEHRLKKSQRLLAGTPRRVLYVEHNAMDIELTVRHFAEHAPHVHVDVIPVCADALTRLAHPPAYDAVLIDLRMPDQSGLDFVREAKRRNLPLPPFIMISGQGDDAAAIASLNLGAFDYVSKRNGYLDQLTYAIDRAVAHDRLDHLNAQLQAELVERKRAETALQDEGLFMNTLLDAVPFPVFHKGTDGRYIGFNKAFEELFGKSHDELVGKTAFDINPRELADIHHGKDEELFRAPGVQTYEIKLRDGHGRMHDVVYRKATYADADGRVAGLVGAIVDVTEERKLRATVAQSDRLASMGMLAAGVAHEINNPLSYVLYNLDSLAEDFPRYTLQLAKARTTLVDRLGEAGLRDLLGADVEALDAATLRDAQERLTDALGGTRRIKNIARGLGMFSRVEKDSVAPVDLRYAIESATNIASNEIKYRASVLKDFGPISPVLASDGRLSQVFLNLLVNAAHAIPEGDVERNKISVRTWQEGNDVYAEVKDTGCGIPRENLERIFDPFFTTKPVGVGSGLGLNIARNIITGYGGEIAVTSEIGKGTRFVIRMPAATAEQTGQIGGATEERAAAGVAGRVLVIDDEPGIRGALKRILRAHEVVEADSGEQGLTLLATDQHFDAILCDMMMPRVSGMDVHRWLLEHHPQLARKVIFVTGGAFTPNTKEYLETVDNLRIEKPFDATNLRKMVAKYVSASKAGEGSGPR